MKPNSEAFYVAYRGDECIGVNTLEGWAKEFGTNAHSIANRAKPCYRKQVAGSETAIIFERVIDDDDDA